MQTEEWREAVIGYFRLRGWELNSDLHPITDELEKEIMRWWSSLKNPYKEEIYEAK